MKIKAWKLAGAALDWAVVKAQGSQPTIRSLVVSPNEISSRIFLGDDECNPSTEWAQGGPIIERERIEPAFIDNPEINELAPTQPWVTSIGDSTDEYPGPTILVAAMRCYVGSKLGWELDVPDELLASFDDESRIRDDADDADDALARPRN